MSVTFRTISLPFEAIRAEYLSRTQWLRKGWPCCPFCTRYKLAPWPKTYDRYNNFIYLYNYIIESVCLFVCLFAVNAKTTARIDAKRSGITMNDPESVLCVLKSPVLVFLGRYRDISGFLFAADRHFNLSHFHFRLLRRRLTMSAFVKRRRPCATSLFHR